MPESPLRNSSSTPRPSPAGTGFPDTVLDVLRSRIGQTRLDIVAAIRIELPGFEGLLSTENSILHRTIDRTLADFLRRVAGGPSAPVQRDFYRDLGRVQAECHGTAGAVSAALRVGMKVSWRHLTMLGRDGRLSSDSVWRLGEIALQLFDEISSSVQAGFLGADAFGAEDREARRAELLARLFSERDGDWGAVEHLARRASWSLPETICAVVLDAGDAPVPPPPREDVLVDAEGPVPRMLVPNPDEEPWLDELTAALGDVRALIGPTVRVADAVQSFNEALEMRELVQTGLVPDEPVVRCADNLRALLIMRNRRIIMRIADRALLPLKSLDQKRRARYGSTLLAWLKSRGNIAEVAERLGIHHQTARYRMREMFRRYGDLLDDPDYRFELELVLRTIDALFDGADGSELELPTFTTVLHQHGIHDIDRHFGTS
jgi:hypothetical protein